MYSNISSTSTFLSSRSIVVDFAFICLGVSKIITSQELGLTSSTSPSPRILDLVSIAERIIISQLKEEDVIDEVLDSDERTLVNLTKWMTEWLIKQSIN